MTLQWSNCGSYALKLTSQSYSDTGGAFESYRCESCSERGSLAHNAITNRTTLSGCLGSDWE